MFRSDLQGGIGSILGNHLDPYRQYLQQTYIQPQSQQQLNLFMDSIQQQEQEFFGPPVSGGQMSSAANPGSTLALGGLPPPLGQVGSLAQNPFMAVSSFDAQVARTQNTPAYSGPEIGRKRAAEPPSLVLGVPQMPMQPGAMAASPFGNNVNPHSPGMSRGDFFAPPSTDSAHGRLSATNATAAFAGMGIDQFTPFSGAPMDPRSYSVDAEALRSGSVFAPEHRRLV